MVRFKTRWLLVKMEQDCSIQTSGGGSTHSSARRRCSSPATGALSIHKDSNKGPESVVLPTSKKEFVTRLRKTIGWSYGLAGGESLLAHTNVKFYDSTSGLVLIRCPRQHCGQVRAAVTLLLTPKQVQAISPASATPMRDDKSRNNNHPDTSATAATVFSVVSIHGSTRTAKIAAMRMVRSVYRQKLLMAKQRKQQQQQETQQTTSSFDLILLQEEHQLCRELRDRLGTLSSVD